MTDLLKTLTLCMTLMLITGCASRERAANGKHATVNPAVTVSQASGPICDSNRVAEMIKAVNSADTSFYAKFDFGESDVLGWLFKCADVAFKTEDGEFILLSRPEPLGRIPVSELDRVLAKPGLRKELAVVFIEQWWGVYTNVVTKGEFAFMDPRQKTPSDFAFEVHQKLREAGFKQVIFASKSHGLFRRMRVDTNPTWEEALKKRASTNIAADDPDVKALQGAWVPVKAELDAQPLAEEFLQELTLNLTNHDYEVTYSREQIDFGTWSLDALGNPKGMTIAGIKGRNAGRAYPCIYEINGDTLRICYAFSGAKRPTEFKTATNSNLYLVTYNRKK